MGRFILITGSDDYAVKTRARALAGELAGGDPAANPDWELLRGDAADAETAVLLGEAANSLCTPPFFGPAKTLWLMNFAGFDKLDGSDAEIKAALDRLTGVLKAGLPEEVHFLWSGAGLDLRKASAKALKALPGAEVEVYNTANPKGKDYQLVMQNRIREISLAWGKNLDPKAAELLIASVNGDTARLKTELEKLFTYLGEDRGKATLEDVRAVVSATPEALGWEFSDALRNRDQAGALKVVNTLIRQMKGTRSSGFELSILYTAAGAFGDLLATRRAMAELGVPKRFGPNYFQALAPELKERFPDNILLGMHPFRAYKVCEAALTFGDRALRDAFEALLEANQSLVTGRGEARLVLEQMIQRICKK